MQYPVQTAWILEFISDITKFVFSNNYNSDEIKIPGV